MFAFGGTACDHALLAFRRLRLDPLPVEAHGRAELLQTGVQQHRANNQKRITWVRKYLEAEDTRFQLALPCLCLRLTSLATSITGQKNRRGDRDSAVDAQAGVRVPLMVRLARGDVSERTARELTSILQALRHDATVAPRLGEVVTRLLMTAGQVILRFSQYEGTPLGRL